MTPILKVITEYCAVYVDDINLSDLQTADAPLYARRMWQYLNAAIPLFTLPAEMGEYLCGTAENPKLTEPRYDSATVTLSEETGTVTLGDEYKGYDICAGRIRRESIIGDVCLTPIAVSYDAETATVSFDTLPAGTVIEFDFYADGNFAETLSGDVMSILGICFQLVWTDRFSTDWLSNVSKVEDKSFTEQNRANKMRADTERLNAIRHKLAGEMRRYEQNLYYKSAVKTKLKI